MISLLQSGMSLKSWGMKRADFPLFSMVRWRRMPSALVPACSHIQAAEDHKLSLPMWQVLFVSNPSKDGLNSKCSFNLCVWVYRSLLGKLPLEQPGWVLLLSNSCLTGVGNPLKALSHLQPSLTVGALIEVMYVQIHVHGHAASRYLCIVHNWDCLIERASISAMADFRSRRACRILRKFSLNTLFPYVQELDSKFKIKCEIRSFERWLSAMQICPCSFQRHAQWTQSLNATLSTCLEGIRKAKMSFQGSGLLAKAKEHKTIKPTQPNPNKTKLYQSMLNGIFPIGGTCS